MQSGVEDLDGHVFEEFLVGRQVAAFQIAGIVDQHVGVAGLAADCGEGRGDRLLRDKIQFDDHALAALFADCLRQPRGVGFPAGRQHGEETFLREFLRDRAADPPPHADLDIAVVDRMAMRQQGVAALGLPLGGGADHDGDLLAPPVRFHPEIPFVRPMAQIIGHCRLVGRISKAQSANSRRPGVSRRPPAAFRALRCRARVPVWRPCRRAGSTSRAGGSRCEPRRPAPRSPR